MKNNDKEWITVSKGATLLGVSKRTMQRRCDKGDYEVRQTPGNGGLKYEIKTESIYKKHSELFAAKIQEDEAKVSHFNCESGTKSGTSYSTKKTSTCENDIWLGATESGTLFTPKKDKKWVIRQCHAGEFIWDWQTTRGGRQIVIALSSLPIEARAAYWSGKTKIEDDITDSASAAEEAKILADAPEYNRQQAEKYLLIIKAADGLKGTQLKSFIKAWNTGHDPALKTSYARLLSARNSYESQGAAGLLGSYGKRLGQTKVDDLCFNYFKDHYLVERGPSAEDVRLETKGYAKRVLGLDTDDFPHVSAFMRRLRKEVPADAIELARYGPAAWNRKRGYFVDRTMNMAAGQVWFSDHRQLDVLCFPDAVPPMARKALRAFLKKNISKKPARPWITVWRDMRTGLWLSCYVHIAPPNSDHILMALATAIKKYGVPKHLYIDNGKDYKARHFSGGRYVHKLDLDEKRITSLTAALHINSIFCWPFNPQAKTIERDFGDQAGGFDKRMRGYIGNNTVNKPESSKAHAESGNILHFEQLESLLTTYVEQVLNQKASLGKTLQGRSRAEAWNEEFDGLPRVDDDTLKLYCMAPSKAKQLGRNGYKDEAMGMWYFAEWMFGQRSRTVYMRRDPQQYQIGYFFDDDTDEYIGRGELQLPVPGLAETNVDKDDVRAAIRRRKKSEQIAKSYAANREGDEQEQMANLIAGIGEQHEPKQNDGKVGIIMPMERRIRKTGTDDDEPVDRGNVVQFEFEK